MSEHPIVENIDIQKIMEYIPHRYPFVLVDRILSMEVGKEVVGLKNVTINEPFFQGHFPEKPVMPGVLILEGLAQTGCVMAFYATPEAVGKKLMFFAGIDKARFRRPVLPGDQIVYKLWTLKEKRNVIQMAAKAYVEDKLVAEAELLAAFS